jgi:hypothetical protein
MYACPNKLNEAQILPSLLQSIHSVCFVCASAECLRSVRDLLTTIVKSSKRCVLAVTGDADVRVRDALVKVDRVIGKLTCIPNVAVGTITIIYVRRRIGRTLAIYNVQW